MQALFDTRALSLLDGATIVATGVVLLLIREGEKWLRSRTGRWKPALDQR
jgi:hypothetical protein